MTTTATNLTHSATAPAAAGRLVTAVGWLMALWCLGFTAPNIVYEVTDHFAGGPLADYAGAFTVMNWLVVGLKVVGAVVAVMSVTGRPRSHGARMLLAVSLWGAFATLALYNLGSVAEAIGMVSGLTGTVDDIDLASVAYALFFSLAAVGFGILAVSYARRQHLPGWPAVVGALGAPVIIGLVLVAVPALLTAVGVMPQQ